MADEKELTAEVETPATEAPAEAAEAPVEAAEAPVEAAEAPVEAPEAPAEAVEAPAEAVEEPVEEAPAEAAEEPVEEAPAEAAEEPVEETPAEAAEEPVEEAPAEAAEEPVEEAPVEAAEEAPAEAAEEPVEEAPAEAAEEAVEKTPAEAAKAPAQKQTTAKDAVLTTIGIILCVILAPVLIANLTMIVKSYVNADEVPSFGGYCPFIVLTDSMTPTINSGDLVIDKVVTDPSQVKKGDVISFFDPASKSNSIVTHRVVEIVSDSDGIAFRTQGDGNNTIDESVVPGKNVTGIYITKLSGMGHVVMFMQSTPGLVVCIALPILLLIGYDALRRRKYDKQQKTDTEALLKELEELRAKQGK